VGLAWSFAQGTREPYWPRAQLALVVGLVLTTTSLIATVRFFDEFRIGKDSGSASSSPGCG